MVNTVVSLGVSENTQLFATMTSVTKPEIFGSYIIAHVKRLPARHVHEHTDMLHNAILYETYNYYL